MGGISYPKELYRNSKDFAGEYTKVIFNDKILTRKVAGYGQVEKVVNGVSLNRQYLWLKAHGFEFYPEVNKFPLVSASKGLVECINTGEITYSDETKYVVCSVTSEVLLRSEAEKCRKTWVKKGWGRISSAYYNFTTASLYTEQAIDAFNKRYPTKTDFCIRVQEILDEHWDGDIGNVPEGYHLHHNHKTGYVAGFIPSSINKVDGYIKSAANLECEGLSMAERKQLILLMVEEHFPE